MPRITITLDGVQLAWLDALADLHQTSRAAVMREALLYLSARESVRVERTARYRLIGILARCEEWDPITSYLNGRR